MLILKIRIPLQLTLCLMLSACCPWECGCDTCVEYQDVAYVDLRFHNDIDSVVIKVNDSITGCNTWYEWMVGSETHRIRFPIDVRIQLFSQGDLWKELSFEMDKNTRAIVYYGSECSSNISDDVESAKKQNRFTNSSSTDDYCWFMEKIDSKDLARCIETSLAPEDPCVYSL